MPEAALRSAYGSLLEPPAARPGERYVVPGRAGESPLIRRLLGRDGEGRHGGLDRRELILFIEWVDLGAAWDARPADGGRTP